MIYHVPHASFDVPFDLRSAFLLDDQALEDELRVMTDAFTDDLFGCHARDDDSVVIFPVSRLVLDPERLLDDMLEMMSWMGMGVIYQQTSSGNPLRNNPSLEERDELIRRFYMPHHQRLTEATESELNRCDTALILDCHSFPSRPLDFECDQDPDRPEICLGTDPFHSPPDLIEAARLAVTDEGLTCRINRPYGGAIVPSRYREQEQRVSSIMIEVNRSLYMDEGTGGKSGQYERCRASLGRIIEKIRRVDLPHT